MGKHLVDQRIAPLNLDPRQKLEAHKIREGQLVTHDRRRVEERAGVAGELRQLIGGHGPVTA